LASSVDVSLSQWPEANEAIKELAADNKYLRAQIEQLKKSIN